jgi:hypothetical protein
MDANILYKEITPNLENTDTCADNTCIICMEENEEKIIFDCSHTICLICYEKLLNSKSNDITCPFCRGLIEKQNVITMNITNNEDVNRIYVRRNIIKMCIAMFVNLIILIIKP